MIVFGAVFCIWNLIGLFILGMTSSIDEVLSLRRLNPINVYQCHHKVNYFGCFWLTLFYNLLCPVASAFYWFYVCCTIGRKASKCK